MTENNEKNLRKSLEEFSKNIQNSLEELGNIYEIVENDHDENKMNFEKESLLDTLNYHLEQLQYMDDTIENDINNYLSDDSEDDK